jgi:hypothetical protein
MVGFIKGFFGAKSKTQRVETVEQKQPDTSSSAEQLSKAFFLEPDDAKTFGNIEYMRSPKTTRRTFPKTQANGEEFDFIQQVSALEVVKSDGKELSSTPTVEANPKPIAPQKPQESNRSTSTDTNLDMFRRMARDIKKG